MQQRAHSIQNFKANFQLKFLYGFFFCSLTLASFISTAQQVPVNNETEPTAVKLKGLKGTLEDKQSLRLLLNRFENLQATFTQTITDIQGNELQTSSGKISLEKPQKLIWEVTEPEESMLIADSATVFNIDPFTEQVTLLDQQELTNSNPLMLLMTDDLKQWDKVTVSQDKSVAITRYNVVSLSSNSPITAVTLTFNEQGKLSSLVSIDRQQQQNVVEFDAVIYDASIPINAFKFDVPQGWVVDDQRSQKIEK